MSGVLRSDAKHGPARAGTQAGHSAYIRRALLYTAGSGETCMNALKAFNFREWIDRNREYLKPPVNNRLVFRESEFIIMGVGGPNSRSDYPADPAEEFFYQLEGDMTLRTMQAGPRVDIPIPKGKIF